MTDLTLDVARKISDAALAKCRELKLKPMAVAVLDARGTPIAGLYVAGNDMHSVMGGEYPAPGITLGPALTFGWAAGMHLAHGHDEHA